MAQHREDVLIAKSELRASAAPNKDKANKTTTREPYPLPNGLSTTSLDGEKDENCHTRGKNRGRLAAIAPQTPTTPPSTLYEPKSSTSTPLLTEGGTPMDRDDSRGTRGARPP